MQKSAYPEVAFSWVDLSACHPLRVLDDVNSRVAGKKGLLLVFAVTSQDYGRLHSCKSVRDCSTPLCLAHDTTPCAFIFVVVQTSKASWQR